MKPTSAKAWAAVVAVSVFGVFLTAGCAKEEPAEKGTAPRTDPAAASNTAPPPQVSPN